MHHHNNKAITHNAQPHNIIEAFTIAKLKVLKELCTKPLDKYNAYDVRRKLLLVYVQLYPIGYVLYSI